MSTLRNKLFQSTLPRGSDNFFSCHSMYPLCISIHAPSRERLSKKQFTDSGIKFQSTLPRGSDPHLLEQCLSLCISIHAPSRERRFTIISCTYRVNFNPRSLAGATHRQQKNKALAGISIHAPSRERPLKSALWSASSKFQSTLPRGSDHYPIPLFNKSSTFQSTLPRGSDSRKRAIARDTLISIHAPSRERLRYSLLLLGL